MYLATVFVNLELDLEVTQTDRERLLRSIRDRLKQNYGSRITARTDDNCAIVIAFFDDHYTRAQGRLDEIVDRVDSFGEARIESSHCQIFAWHEGAFQETRNHLDLQTLGLAHLEKTPNSKSPSRADKTIVYGQDDDQTDYAGASKTGFTRRNLRIPTRK